LEVDVVPDSWDELHARTASGDWNMLFSKTWGAPYDPHSYMADFNRIDSGPHVASIGMEEPMTQERLLGLVEEVQEERDDLRVASLWEEILSGLHEQAIYYPFYGYRQPAVISRRLFGYQPAPEAYTYPLETVRVFEGSTIVTINPGSWEGRRFENVGPIHPHQYDAPFYVQSWVYEGT
jgi:nickel transport system substrate-binding protein